MLHTTLRRFRHYELDFLGYGIVFPAEVGVLFKELHKSLVRVAVSPRVADEQSVGFQGGHGASFVRDRG